MAEFSDLKLFWVTEYQKARTNRICFINADTVHEPGEWMALIRWGNGKEEWSLACIECAEESPIRQGVLPDKPEDYSIPFAPLSTVGRATVLEKYSARGRVDNEGLWRYHIDVFNGAEWVEVWNGKVGRRYGGVLFSCKLGKTIAQGYYEFFRANGVLKDYDRDE